MSGQFIACFGGEREAENQIVWNPIRTVTPPEIYVALQAKYDETFANFKLYPGMFLPSKVSKLDSPINFSVTRWPEGAEL